jgi:hypothetical protein
MNTISKQPLAAPKTNVLLFPALIAERETKQNDQVAPSEGKQTFAVNDDHGNIYRYRSEFDNFGAAEDELFETSYRRARNGKLLAPDGSEIACPESGGDVHRAKVQVVEADAAAGLVKAKIGAGFPILSAIRKKDGNIVQESEGDNRRAFEIISQLLRSDFDESNRDYRSRTTDGIYFEEGEVNFSNDGRHFETATMAVDRREKTSPETISHTDPKTGMIWTDEIETFKDDGVRQIRGERLAWTWLDLEFSPHQNKFEKKSHPKINDGPAVFNSDQPVVSTLFTNEIKHGNRVQLEWIVSKVRKTRTTRTGTSIWYETTRTPVGHDGSSTRDLKLVRQTIATVVDYNAADPRRDLLEAETRIEPTGRLRALKACLGPEMFATAKMAFRDDMDVGQIADTFGLGSRGSAAVAREIRIVCLKAIRLYKKLSNKADAIAHVAANDNQPARQMAA